jgi:putative membrane protein
MIRRNILAGLAGFTFAVPLARHAAAQSGQAGAQGGNTELRQRIVAASTFAVATSRLAATRGTAATVKAFAGFEIAEQTAIMHAMELASLPLAQVQLDAEHAQQLRQLGTLNGADFDRMYLQGQLTGHRELLALHQRSASSGARDEKIISTIAVAGIQQHIAMLQSMQGLG